jgi:hypothetical protein
MTAFWTVGLGDWPADGEIDIIENVNEARTNNVALHTSDYCTVKNNPNQTAVWVNTDCSITKPENQGCAATMTEPFNYGAEFNANGGGVYAMEWTSTSVSIWFFPPTGVPESLLDSSEGVPDPNTFGIPSATFAGPCSNSFGEKFFNHSIVIDTTFCGGWAGNTFGSGASTCPIAAGKTPMESCIEYVANNPEAMEQAYWDIRSVRVYEKVPAFGNEDILLPTPLTRPFPQTAQPPFIGTSLPIFEAPFASADVDATITSTTDSTITSMLIPEETEGGIAVLNISGFNGFNPDNFDQETVTLADPDVTVPAIESTLAQITVPIPTSVSPQPSGVLNLETSAELSPTDLPATTDVIDPAHGEGTFPDWTQDPYQTPSTDPSTDPFGDAVDIPFSSPGTAGPSEIGIPINLGIGDGTFSDIIRSLPVGIPSQTPIPRPTLPIIDDINSLFPRPTLPNIDNINSFFPWPTPPSIDDINSLFPKPTLANVDDINSLFPWPTPPNIDEINSLFPTPTLPGIDEFNSLFPTPTLPGIDEFNSLFPTPTLPGIDAIPSVFPTVGPWTGGDTTPSNPFTPNGNTGIVPPGLSNNPAPWPAWSSIGARLIEQLLNLAENLPTSDLENVTAVPSDQGLSPPPVKDHRGQAIDGLMWLMNGEAEDQLLQLLGYGGAPESLPGSGQIGQPEVNNVSPDLVDQPSADESAWPIATASEDPTELSTPLTMETAWPIATASEDPTEFSTPPTMETAMPGLPDLPSTSPLTPLTPTDTNQAMDGLLSLLDDSTRNQLAGLLLPPRPVFATPPRPIFSPTPEGGLSPLWPPGTDAFPPSGLPSSDPSGIIDNVVAPLSPTETSGAGGGLLSFLDEDTRNQLLAILLSRPEPIATPISEWEPEPDWESLWDPIWLTSIDDVPPPAVPSFNPNEIVDDATTPLAVASLSPNENVDAATPLGGNSWEAILGTFNDDTKSKLDSIIHAFAGLHDSSLALLDVNPLGGLYAGQFLPIFEQITSISDDDKAELLPWLTGVNDASADAGNLISLLITRNPSSLRAGLQVVIDEARTYVYTIDSDRDRAMAAVMTALKDTFAATPSTGPIQPLQPTLLPWKRKLEEGQSAMDKFRDTLDEHLANGANFNDVDESQLAELYGVFADPSLDSDTKNWLMKQMLDGYDNVVKTFISQNYDQFNSVLYTLSKDERQQFLDSLGEEPLIYDRLHPRQLQNSSGTTDDDDEQGFLEQQIYAICPNLDALPIVELIADLGAGKNTTLETALLRFKARLETYIATLRQCSAKVQRYAEALKTFLDQDKSTSQAISATSPVLSATGPVTFATSTVTSGASPVTSTLSPGPRKKMKRQVPLDSSGNAEFDAFLQHKHDGDLGKWRYGILGENQKDDLHTFIMQAMQCAIEDIQKSSTKSLPGLPPCINDVTRTWSKIQPFIMKSEPTSNNTNTLPLASSGNEASALQSPVGAGSGGTPIAPLANPLSKNYEKVLNPKWMTNLRDLSFKASKTPGVSFPTVFVQMAENSLKRNWSHMSPDVQKSVLTMLEQPTTSGKLGKRADTPVLVKVPVADAVSKVPLAVQKLPLPTENPPSKLPLPSQTLPSRIPSLLSSLNLPLPSQTSPSGIANLLSSLNLPLPLPDQNRPPVIPNLLGSPAVPNLPLPTQNLPPAFQDLLKGLSLPLDPSNPPPIIPDLLAGLNLPPGIQDAVGSLKLPAGFPDVVAGLKSPEGLQALLVNLTSNLPPDLQGVVASLNPLAGVQDLLVNVASNPPQTIQDLLTRLPPVIQNVAASLKLPPGVPSLLDILKPAPGTDPLAILNLPAGMQDPLAALKQKWSKPGLDLQNAVLAILKPAPSGNIGRRADSLDLQQDPVADALNKISSAAQKLPLAASNLPQAVPNQPLPAQNKPLDITNVLASLNQPLSAQNLPPVTPNLLSNLPTLNQLLSAPNQSPDILKLLASLKPQLPGSNLLQGLLDFLASLRPPSGMADPLAALKLPPGVDLLATLNLPSGTADPLAGLKQNWQKMSQDGQNNLLSILKQLPSGKLGKRADSLDLQKDPVADALNKISSPTQKLPLAVPNQPLPAQNKPLDIKNVLATLNQPLSAQIKSPVIPNLLANPLIPNQPLSAQNQPLDLAQLLASVKQQLSATTPLPDISTLLAGITMPPGVLDVLNLLNAQPGVPTPLGMQDPLAALKQKWLKSGQDAQNSILSILKPPSGKLGKRIPTTTLPFPTARLPLLGLPNLSLTIPNLPLPTSSSPPAVPNPLLGFPNLPLSILSLPPPTSSSPPAVPNPLLGFPNLPLSAPSLPLPTANLPPAIPDQPLGTPDLPLSFPGLPLSIPNPPLETPNSPLPTANSPPAVPSLPPNFPSFALIPHMWPLSISLPPLPTLILPQLPTKLPLGNPSVPLPTGELGPAIPNLPLVNPNIPLSFPDLLLPTPNPPSAIPNLPVPTSYSPPAIQGLLTSLTVPLPASNAPPVIPDLLAGLNLPPAVQDAVASLKLPTNLQDMVAGLKPPAALQDLLVNLTSIPPPTIPELLAGLNLPPAVQDAVASLNPPANLQDAVASLKPPANLQDALAGLKLPPGVQDLVGNLTASLPPGVQDLLGNLTSNLPLAINDILGSLNLTLPLPELLASVKLPPGLKEVVDSIELPPGLKEVLNGIKLPAGLKDLVAGPKLPQGLQDFLGNLTLIPPPTIPDLLASINLPPSIPDLLANMRLPPTIPDLLANFNLPPSFPDLLAGVKLPPAVQDVVTSIKLPLSNANLPQGYPNLLADLKKSLPQSSQDIQMSIFTILRQPLTSGKVGKRADSPDIIKNLMDLSAVVADALNKTSEAVQKLPLAGSDLPLAALSLPLTPPSLPLVPPTQLPLATTPEEDPLELVDSAETSNPDGSSKPSEDSDAFDLLHPRPVSGTPNTESGPPVKFPWDLPDAEFPTFSPWSNFDDLPDTSDITNPPKKLASDAPGATTPSAANDAAPPEIGTGFDALADSSESKAPVGFGILDIGEKDPFGITKDHLPPKEDKSETTGGSSCHTPREILAASIPSHADENATPEEAVKGIKDALDGVGSL